MIKTIYKYFYFILGLLVIIPWRGLVYNQKWSTKINDTFSISGFYFFPKDIKFIEDLGGSVIINFADELELIYPYKKRLNEKNIKVYTFSVKDRTPVKKEQLEEAYKIVREEIIKGNKIHINCAMGQSRSAMFLVYCLVKENIVNSVDEGISYVKILRPQIYLNKRQYNELLGITF